MLVVHNQQMLDWIRSEYSRDDIDRLLEFLTEAGTLEFRALSNGLFPAAVADEYTGYNNVWVRDNIHVAHAHLFCGQPEIAARTIEALTEFFGKYRHRLEAAVAGTADLQNVMNRPHIRFNGQHLEENEEQWSHAQNDAIGYYLWLLGKLAEAGHMQLSADQVSIVAGFVRYLAVVQFWEDEDSGHWEETRKIAASSIGIATAGLVSIRSWLEASGRWDDCQFDGQSVEPDDFDQLILRGRKMLDAILPCECQQEDDAKFRRYDGALLFLACPVGIVSEERADRIVTDIIENLAGPYGIRRYIGDSYWCADYKEKLNEELRTSDFSDDISGRDALLEPGAEAQWCIFDPIISVYYGQRFAQSGRDEDRRLQVEYFNRSLGQLTSDEGAFPGLRCPESYYRRRGSYEPNDITPLLWTQGNLWMAIQQMQATS